MTKLEDGSSTEKYEWFGLTRLEFIEREDMRSAMCHFCKKSIRNTNFYTLLEWGYCSRKCANKALHDMKQKYLIDVGKPLKGTSDWIYHILLVNSKRHGADKIPNYVKGESHSK